MTTDSLVMPKPGVAGSAQNRDFRRDREYRLVPTNHPTRVLTAERIRAEKPDVVVIATGCQPALPEIPGLAAALESGFARTIDRVLGEGIEGLEDGPILIWGGAEGVELALDLARGGRKVRLLEPCAKFAPAAYIARALCDALGGAGGFDADKCNASGEKLDKWVVLTQKLTIWAPMRCILLCEKALFCRS